MRNLQYVFRKIKLLGGSYVLDVSVVKNLKVFHHEKSTCGKEFPALPGLKMDT